MSMQIVNAVSANIGMQVVGALVSSVVSPLLAPAQKWHAQHEQFCRPYELPSFEMALNAWQRGFFGKEDFENIANGNGIPLQTKPYTDYVLSFQAGVGQLLDIKFTDDVEEIRSRSIWWHKVVDSLVPRPSFESYSWMRARGLMKSDDYWKALKKIGVSEEQFGDIERSIYTQPDASTVITVANRNGWSKEFTTRLISQTTGMEEHWSNYVAELKNYIPTVEKLVYYTVKEAFNPDIIKEHRLYAEFPDVVRRYFDMNGAGYEIKELAGIIPGGKTPTVADLEWMSHWQPISVTVASEALRRLRPERVNRFRPIEPFIEPFTLTDFNRWMRVNDYPVTARPILAALTSAQLTRVDLRRAFVINAIEKEELYEQYRDLGYVPDDATTLVKIAFDQKSRSVGIDTLREDKNSLQVTKKIALQSLSDGVSSEAETVEALVRIGLSRETAGRLAVTTILREKLKQAREVVRSVKRSLFSGAINISQAYEALDKHKIQRQRSQDLIDLWTVQLDLPRRAASVKQVIQWYVDGFIEHKDAASRLFNLGINEPDRALYLWAAEETKAAAADKAITKAAMNDKQRASALAKVAKEVERKKDSVLGRLASVQTPSRVQRWLRNNVIEPLEAKEMLAGRGISVKDVNLLVKEAMNERKLRNTTEPVGQNGTKEKATETAP